MTAERLHSPHWQDRCHYFSERWILLDLHTEGDSGSETEAVNSLIKDILIHFFTCLFKHIKWVLDGFKAIIYATSRYQTFLIALITSRCWNCFLCKHLHKGTSINCNCVQMRITFFKKLKIKRDLKYVW